MAGIRITVERIEGGFNEEQPITPTGPKYGFIVTEEQYESMFAGVRLMKLPEA